jgi:hypothetical protein
MLYFRDLRAVGLGKTGLKPRLQAEACSTKRLQESGPATDGLLATPMGKGRGKAPVVLHMRRSRKPLILNGDAVSTNSPERILSSLRAFRV